jgi:hypothetical protein
MRSKIWKWGSRVLWMLAALYILYCLVQLADYLWFQTHVPRGFQDANWSGRWQTEQYNGFSGRLLVRLRDPLPENQDFKAEAMVYYPIYSGWKTGRFVKMDFTGRFTPDAPTSAGQNQNVIPGSGGKLKFEGVVDDQRVEYTALLNKSRTKIVGGYLSSGPYDYGFFVVSYY